MVALRVRFGCLPLLVALLAALGLAGCVPADPTDAASPAAAVPTTHHVSEAAQTRARAYDLAWKAKLLEVSPEEAALVPTRAHEPASDRYTLMVYMVGSNLESMNAAATKDLAEMVSADLDFSQVNVVVYAGGCRRWNNDIPTGVNSVLDLSLPKGDRIVAQTRGSVSMGAPETLSAFVNFCAERYPAEHTALVFWDHGGGPLWGYGYDDAN